MLNFHALISVSVQFPPILGRDYFLRTVKKGFTCFQLGVVPLFAVTGAITAHLAPVLVFVESLGGRTGLVGYARECGDVEEKVLHGAHLDDLWVGDTLLSRNVEHLVLTTDSHVYAIFDAFKVCGIVC